MQPFAESPQQDERELSERRSLHRERRCHPRHAATGLFAWSPRFRARVLDVSATGLRFSTTARLSIGEQLSFHLLGENLSVASAVVRWCELDSVFEAAGGKIESVYHVGMSLLHEPRRLALPR